MGSSDFCAIAQAAELGVAQVITEVEVPSKPSSPNLPLNMVLGYSDILLDETKPSTTLTETRDELSTIRSAGAHPLGLIDNPLAISRPDAPTIRLDPDIIAAFKADGSGWQSRINDALRKAAGL